MNETIKLSIVIPCFNHGKYINECIESTHFQEHNFVEVLVVNDGSTDLDTIEALDQLKYERLTIIHQENKGVASARNNGVASAKGEFILFLDADNTINPNYYLKALEHLETHLEDAVFYSDPIHFGIVETQEIDLPDFSFERLIASNFIDVCAVIRKSLWEQIGGFDTAIQMGYEDWEFWINAAVHGAKFHHCKEKLFYYRVAENSVLTEAKKDDKRKQTLMYLINKYKVAYTENIHGVVGHYIDFLTNYERIVESDLKEKAHLKSHLHELHGQNAHAMNSILNLQQRINRIEASKPYKLYKFVKVLKNRFSSNFSDNKRKSFFRKAYFLASKRGRSFVKKILAKVFKHMYIWMEDKKVYIVEAGGGNAMHFDNPYSRWLERNLPTSSKLTMFKQEMRGFTKKPLFSIVIPVYNPRPDHLRAAIDSIINQVYPHWELCLADDCSTNSEIKEIIEEFKATDKRIKVVYREKNGHISAASNSGLEIATGDYIVLMDQDDLITQDALFQNAKVINKYDEVDLIYSDEDKIDDDLFHSYPHFKPDWSPDSLLSRNYLGHLTVFKTTLMRQIGGWREGFEGSQDYDLVLRFTELTNAIYHIPLVLYHWRIHETSAAAGEEAKPYAYLAAKKALTEALTRRNEPGTVDFLDGFRGYSIRYELKNTTDLVSIIIPTKDKTSILSKCIESIFEKSTYKNFEVVLVDNNSEEQEFFDYVETCKNRFGSQFKVIREEIPFNFSTLINRGVEASLGNYLLLLNNDTEVITPDWIEGMIEQAQRPSIGVVGVKLLYPNNTIQHAGVVMGLGGAAGHVLVGEDRFGPGYFNYVNMLNNYTVVTAACIMVRRDVFEAVNGFDELFTVEYNDVDFCLKIHALGYQNIYVPHVELYHYESISRGHPHMTKESYARHIREVGLLKDKWMDYIDHDPCYNPNLTLGAHDFALRE